MTQGKFLLVETESGEQKVVYSHASSPVKDSKGQTFVFPTGGRAIIKGKIVKEME
ncbi:30S ribosomal protein S27e [Candidatus Micrarchaeota archaeon]|nr:30S ribosomal protein S27e [Candidatus Micrarchaeota archaeon]